jgi:hypothetical protein
MDTSDDAEQLGDLFIPSLAFESPLEVVEDPDLMIGEKRSILSAWASDARAVKNSPALRQVNGRSQATIDDILAALRLLDRVGQNDLTVVARKVYRRASIDMARSPEKAINSTRQLPP